MNWGVSLGAPVRTRVLIVEDNPITRKVIRSALKADNYEIREAECADQALESATAFPPALILQDLQLPGRGGWELVRELRALPGLSRIPIIAMSGYVTESEEDESVLAAGFTEYISKPFDVAHLRETVRRHLGRPGDDQRSGQARKVLVVDDDPLQRRLTSMLFNSHGFLTSVASSGFEALHVASAVRPDVILSDVLMPEMDGMQLSSAIRSNPELGSIPVVLVSSFRHDQVDRHLARRMGALRLVGRTAGGIGMVDAVLEVLAEPPPVPWPQTPRDDAEHAQWLSLQLDRQVAINSALSARCALQSAALSALGAVSESISRNLDPYAAMDLILKHGLDAAGLSRGALFWRAPDGVLTLRSVVGYDATNPLLAQGTMLIQEIIDELILTGESRALPSIESGSPRVHQFLQSIDAASALLVPIRTDDPHSGLLMLVSGKRDLSGLEWFAFGRTLAANIGQATMLARALDRWRASEHLLQSIMDNAGSAIYVKDREGRYLLANREFESSMNHDRSKLTAITDFDLFPREIAEKLRATDREVLETGATLTREEIMRSRGTDRTFVSAKFPLRDETGRTFGVGGISTDITDRKQAEALVRQSQRMEAIGQLAGGVAHDFNNILSVILGHNELAMGDLQGAMPEVAAQLAVVQRAANRATGLTRQLLAFSRRQVLQLRVLDLGTIAKETTGMLRRLIGEDIELAVSVSGASWNVRADPGQIEQVIMNLAVNARDAMPKGGKLTVTVRDQTVAAAGSPDPALPPGRYVQLLVRDTGTGIDEATLPHVFEPFFTTKPRDRGTGLGLSTVYGIVKQSDGYIFVDTELGRGSEFRVYLPAVSAAPDAADRLSRAQATQRGTETILVVDDEQDLRTLAEMVLQRNGYTVLAAHSCARARTLEEMHEGPIHLLLTDVVLPGESGPELARTLIAQQPGLRVLYMSGYTDDAVLRHGLAHGHEKLLAKPFSMESLLRCVREALDGPGTTG
jgi:PAS domain S-box-containing protein